MQLQLLKVSECYESETNPRGDDFEGKQFDELVASIKEKGVLVPVLARLRPKDKWQYEVVAGNRRLRAAWEAGLKEIPAQVQEMTDAEAQEAQIVENLQRADVHPLEEGEAYRKLIEDGGRTVKDVSVKVGKSESYVRQRLFLTNLSEKARKAYRSGKMIDSAAVLVARLTPNNQDALLKEAGPYVLEHPDDMKELIAEQFSEPLKNQPWLKDKEAMAAVGACKECPPARTALFGEARDGACTDLKCCLRKMKAYFAWRIKENPALVLVSTMYGKSEAANVISQSQYQTVKKNACEFATQALIGEGINPGSLIWVCFDKDCQEHRKQRSEYEPSEKERANRKKEREREEEKRQRFDVAVCEALGKLKWPLSDKHLDALFDIMLSESRTTTLMPLVKRHNLKGLVKKHDGYSTRDYETPLRELAEGAGKDGKLRMIFELLLPTYYIHSDDKHMKKLIAKL
jgi:ParB family chromosome partitioning protein